MFLTGRTQRTKCYGHAVTTHATLQCTITKYNIDSSFALMTKPCSNFIILKLKRNHAGDQNYHCVGIDRWEIKEKNHSIIYLFVIVKYLLPSHVKMAAFRNCINCPL